MSGKSTSKPGMSNEIKLTRVYDAPVAAVWEAWTDPEQVKQWWGPRGFTLTTHGKDLRPGGFWKYTMHGPDGTDYPNKTVYYEVEKHRKLVYDHGGSDDQPPLFRVTVLFSESKGRTTMEMTMALSSPEAAAETRRFIKKAGGNATWDRLAEFLEKGMSGREKFVIARTFAAPIETVFEMWVNPKHLSQWLAPTGMEMAFLRGDIRAGGSTFWFMSGPGMKMYGRAEYLKVERPHTIVYVQQFCDENEKLSRHPKAPSWPASMLTAVELASEGPEATRVTVTWEPYGETKPEEVATFVQHKGGMTMGWTGSFDKLEAYLEQANGEW